MVIYAWLALILLNFKLSALYYRGAFYILSFTISCAQAISIYAMSWTTPDIEDT